MFWKPCPFVPRPGGRVDQALRITLVVALSGTGNLYADALGAPTAVPKAAVAAVSVTLSPTTSPVIAQPATTVAYVIGDKFPSGTIRAADVDISFAAATEGPAATTKALSVASLGGASRRIGFQVPVSLIFSAPRAYRVSVSGATTDGQTFTSANSAVLTINPPAKLNSVQPSSGAPGQRLDVTVSGSYTNFVQGSTRASFGVGIVVGGAAAAGTAGPVTVLSKTSARAQITIAANAATGARDVVFHTGVEQATAQGGFNVIDGTNRAPRITSLPPKVFAWSEIKATGTPPTPRYLNQGVTYDDKNDRLIVFSGVNFDELLHPPRPADVYVLTNATGAAGTPAWLKLNTGGEPPPGREAGIVAYDSEANRLIVHAGCGGNCGPLLGDTWVLTNANGLGGTPTWIRLPDLAPLLEHSAAYDSLNHRLIVFGGGHGGLALTKFGF